MATKFRDGWTGPGAQAADWMLRDGARQHAHRLRDGVLTERNGQFVNVYQDNPAPPPALDGFYSLGNTVGAGTRIVGSADGRTFADRGPAPAQGGFTVAQLGYFGKGFGELQTTESLGFSTNFDDKSCQVFQFDITRTRDGRALKPYFNIPSFLPHGQSETFSTILPGGYWFDGAGHKFFSVTVVPILASGGQQVQAIVVNDDVAAPALGATPFLPNQLGWYADAVVLAPGALLKMDRYLRPTYTGSIVDVAACPGLAFSYSADAGHTWTTLTTPSLWSSELASLVGMPIDTDPLFPDTHASPFNRAMDFAYLKAAPLSRTKSVIQALVPYWDGTQVKAKVKLGVLDRSAGYSITETAVLFDGVLEDALIYSGREPLAIPGGVLIFTRDLSTGATDAWKYPARLRFTADGSGLVDRGVLPAKENYMGLVNGYDPKSLTASVWDGKHSVYASKDYGLTWKRWGTITARGVPPDDAPVAGHEQYSLQDFGVITYLRKDDLPAPAAPLTPWLYDSRLPDPPAP